MQKKNYLSPEKLEELKSELEYLKKTRRMEVADRIREAKAHGDLSENAEYAEAKVEQESIERQIAELAEMIKNAEIIKTSEKSSDVANLGSTVKIMDEAENDGHEKSFTIVGSNEADPVHGRISNESPIGKAILGSKLNDTVTVITPNGKNTYRITGIQ